MAVLTAPGLAGAGLALLLLAHVLSDFLFQSDRMVRDKDKGGTMLRHGLVVFAVHAALWWPFLNALVVIGLLVLTLLHLLFDAWKIKMIAAGGQRSAWFVFDQGLHLASLLALWWFLTSRRVAMGWWKVHTPEWYLGAEAAWFAVVAAAFVFLWVGGAAIVRDLLVDLGVASEGDGRGRVIGILERWLVLVFVLVGQWAALGLVIAAKAIVRYDKVHRHEAFGELFLIGTLASVLVAVVIGVAVRWLVG